MGYYFIYQSQLQSVKSTNYKIIEAGDYHENIFTIQIEYKNGAFLDDRFEIINKNEVVWHGKIYDVVSIDAKGQIISFSCLEDNTETCMMNSVNEHIQKQGDQNPGMKSISGTKNINLYIEDSQRSSTDIAITLHQWDLQVFNLISILTKNIPSPPPRIV